MRGLRLLLATLVLLIPAAAPDSSATEPKSGEAMLPPDVLLITLDTTRADFVGVYAGRDLGTPTIDAVAASGVRFEHAVTPAPITLPAHATILTGLDPPEHGVRNNGRDALPDDLPTIATELEAAGYLTAAVVASRVLDRRFGLDRGFSHYDDVMAAENIGEYGYAERNAAAVTEAAFSWLENASREAPFFLWVHYYDPHAPYRPPGLPLSIAQRERYAGEIRFVDQQVSRLLEHLPHPDNTLLLIAGDHGEGLGEHDERAHGVFLYRTTTRVPLIVAGPGIPQATVISSVVGLRRIAATILRTTGRADPVADMAEPLPFKPVGPDEPHDGAFSEARMQAAVYGWAPLASLTTDRWKYVSGPRPELFDLQADPQETRNLVQSEAEMATAMQKKLNNRLEAMNHKLGAPAVIDDDLASALEALGYVQSPVPEHRNGIDPRRGLRLLDLLERAKNAERRGAHAAAATMLRSLVRQNPDNQPALTHLAKNLLATGELDEAVAVSQQALELNPRSEFLWLNLGEALGRAGRHDEAETAFRKAVSLDPRSALGWLRLADLQTDGAGVLAVLAEALSAGTTSTTVLVRMAEAERDTGNLDRARGLLEKATDLTPEIAELWELRGDVAAQMTRDERAASWYERSLQIRPDQAEVLLKLGTAYSRLGRTAEAISTLNRAQATATSPTTARSAAEKLEAIREKTGPGEF